MADSAQEQEPPLWLAAATKTKSLSSLNVPTNFPIIDLTPDQVRDGPLNFILDQDTEKDSPIEPKDPDANRDVPHYESLSAQLTRYTSQRTTSTLHIKGDAPTSAQFAHLSSYFPKVKNLYIQTGVLERWNDDGFPPYSTWQLELLVISDACGELITAEPIVHGEIKHLVFYLTHNLKFEGCPWAEWIDDPGDQEDVGELRSEWLVNTTTGLPFWEGLHAKSTAAESSRLKKLEILENDAIETFVRFTVAHFGTVRTVQELTIRSLGGTDLMNMPGAILGAVLPRLEKLRCLELSLCHYVYFLGLQVGDDSQKGLRRQSLVRGLPPNLETFYFRGPAAIALDNDSEGRWLAEWAEAFGNEEYLPRLKKVGFWLDQPGPAGPGADEEEEEEQEATASLEEILAARNKVEEILAPVLGKRGIRLVEWDEDGAWRDPWFDEYWPDDAVDGED